VQICRKGWIVSGRGIATQMLAGRCQISDYFGRPPHPGSLNLVLHWPILLRPERAAIRMDDPGYLFWPALFEGRPCLAFRWRQCPLHIVEIVSPHWFSVRKGQMAAINLNRDDTAPLSATRFAGWSLLWLWCRQRLYTDDDHMHWASCVAEKRPRLFAQQRFEVLR